MDMCLYENIFTIIGTKYDFIRMILLFVNDSRTLGRCTRVSKTWMKVINENDMWKSLFILKFPSKLSKQEKEPKRKYFTNFKNLINWKTEFKMKTLSNYQHNINTGELI